MTDPDVLDHPATFTPVVLAAIRDVLDAEVERIDPLPTLRVCDPFAGVGGIHALYHGRITTVGVELEPEWAAPHQHTIQGDATALPADWTDRFDAVATSPAYGNRMADGYDGRDESTRRTYRLSLGRDLTAGSGAGLQFRRGTSGKAYRDLHRAAIAEMVRVVRPGGLIVVNMKNHIRAGEEQLVVEWWIGALLAAGCRMVEVRRVPVSGYGFGQNGDARVDAEHVIVVRAPDEPRPPELFDHTDGGTP